MLRSLPSVLIACVAFVATGAVVSAAALAGGFAFQDAAGEHLDVLLDGQVAARYMYAFDTSTPARRFETSKPYLHVFDAAGRGPITNGPRGVYPHHRGIFIGWKKVTFAGKTYEIWGMNGSAIVHQRFAELSATADNATFTSLTQWRLDAGPTILSESRTTMIRRAVPPARLLIEFTSQLTAVAGDLVLDGDPEHAGVQYRPAAEIDMARTVYVFPGKDANPRVDLDFPWVGESYTLDGKRYSVVYLNHPANPRQTKFSAYRDYGRFGGYFKRELKQGETLGVRYGFLIVDGEMPSAAEVQRAWDRYAGQAAASPVPEITVRPAEKSAPPKPKASPAKPKADKPKPAAAAGK